jgi:hypothetical protein
MTTTTLRQPPLQSCVGLHCDSHEGAPIPCPQRDPVRICINLGLESRYFLFCAPLVSRLALHPDCAVLPMACVVAQRVLASFSNLAVYRLEVRQGEMRMVLTFHIIPDATLLPKSCPHVSFSAIGRFSLGARASAWGLH